MKSDKPKIFRIVTVPISLKILLKGQLSFMSLYFEVVGVSSNGQELMDVQQQEGIRVIPIEMTRVISPRLDLISVYQLYQLFKKEKPEIVHTHTPKAGIVGMLAAWLAGVPIRLHTVAGLPLMEAKGVKRMVLNFVEKLTYACATKIYPNSKGLEQFILNERFTDKQTLTVIGNGSSNGIDTTHFSPESVSESQIQSLKESLFITPIDFVFVFVGRLVGDKGIHELVEAFKQVGQEAPHLKLLLVGSTESDLDPLRPETLYEIQTNHRIIAVGYRPDVRPYLAISNALVFPSYREGFPNVVLQAGAMGLPSIVTDINGCNEIIMQDRNGLIIPTKNIQKLTLEMMRLYTDKSLYNKLQSNARPFIQDRYEQKVIWEAILEEYQRLLKSYNILET